MPQDWRLPRDGCGSHRPGHVQGGDAFAWEFLRKEIALPEARITNGFDTNVIAGEDFLKF